MIKCIVIKQYFYCMKAIHWRIKKQMKYLNDVKLNFKHEKRKQGLFQYETTEKIKQAKAKTSLLRAKRCSEQLLPLLV